MESDPKESKEIGSSNKNKIFRSFMIISIATFFLFRKYINYYYRNSYDDDNVLCITDNTYEYTSLFYNILRTHNNLRIFLQTFISLMLDLNILVFCYLWILRGKSWRIVMTLFIFFSIREFISHNFQIKLDEDIIWGYAGIPSLSISYHKNKTFFFSGTLGLFLIIAVELKSFHFTKLSRFSYINMVLYILLLLSLRAEYSIGIFCSLITAHYSHLLSDKYNHILNDFYDFDQETTNKKKAIELEKNLKIILEKTIREKQKIPEEGNPEYKRISALPASALEISDSS